MSWTIDVDALLRFYSCASILSPVPLVASDRGNGNYCWLYGGHDRLDM
jgi:hypothetical protein